MPLAFGANFVEGKVYRSRKKQEDDEEKQAIRELNAILGIKNRKSCDCEAQIHDLLENCLVCGRLTCVLEGPGKCVSCGSIVLDQEQRAKLSKYIDIIQSPSNIPDHSLSNKEGPKTMIIDDQYDLFSVQNKKHLKEVDRQKLKSDLEELQSKRYQRRLQLNVDITNLEAGSESLPQISDYQAELRRLQINQQPQVDHGANLAELVSKEAKKIYLYEYVPPKDDAVSKQLQSKKGDKSKSQAQPKGKSQPLTKIKVHSPSKQKANSPAKADSNSPTKMNSQTLTKGESSSQGKGSR